MEQYARCIAHRRPMTRHVSARRFPPQASEGAPLARSPSSWHVSIRLHADRAAGRHRHHRRADLAAAPRRAVRPRGRAARPVHQQPEATGPGGHELRVRQPDPPAGGLHQARGLARLDVELRPVSLHAPLPRAAGGLQRDQLRLERLRGRERDDRGDRHLGALVPERCVGLEAGNGRSHEIPWRPVGKLAAGLQQLRRGRRGLEPQAQRRQFHLRPPQGQHERRDLRAQLDAAGRDHRRHQQHADVRRAPPRHLRRGRPGPVPPVELRASGPTP